MNQEETLILAILLRDSLGFSDSYAGYEGKKLLSILSETEHEMITKRSILYKKGKLRKKKLIHLENTWLGQNILEAEYFLSEKMIRRLLGHAFEEENDLDLEIQEQENQNLLVLEPRFSFDEVILPKSKKQTIEITLSQQKYHDKIFQEWGFGKKNSLWKFSNNAF